MKTNTLLKKIHQLQSRLNAIEVSETARLEKQHGYSKQSNTQYTKIDDNLNIKFYLCENETIQEITLKSEVSK